MKPNAVFDAKAACKKLLREARSGALATLMPSSGDPYCSLVNVATAADGAPLLLLSKLALHTQNILADNRVSLMLDEERSGDPLEGARVMLMGKAAATDDAEARRRYLARHPQADMFAGFGDFAFYRVTLKGAHLVAGFGRIVDLTAPDILTDLSGAQMLVSAEAEIVTHINDHHADAVRLYATKLLHGPDGAWRCVGCDPEGLEMQLGHAALRLAFPQRIKSPAELRGVLQQLAQTARLA
jgi:heme oxygenase (biliverdin-IX-beta and delta-forming)